MFFELSFRSFPSRFCFKQVQSCRHVVASESFPTNTTCQEWRLKFMRIRKSSVEQRSFRCVWMLISSYSCFCSVFRLQRSWQYHLQCHFLSLAGVAANGNDVKFFFATSMWVTIAACWVLSILRWSRLSGSADIFLYSASVLFADVSGLLIVACTTVGLVWSSLVESVVMHRFNLL